MIFEFGIKDLVDILLVAAMLYYTYRVMKDSGSLSYFTGVLIFLIVWLVVTHVLEMKLLGSIFDKLVSVGVLALIILFQDDIRRFLLTLGTQYQIGTWLRKVLSRKKDGNNLHLEMMPIVMACMSMSKQKVGALIVVERNTSLQDIVKTGEEVDAVISQRLVENIFFKNSPLHDGAMVIRNKRIQAAGCILPVSHNLNIPKELGLRHRAALGVSQESDAITIVVSEETGGISAAINGEFRLRLTSEQLERILTHEI